MTAYDTNNPFAKILRGEFSYHKLYEDEHVLAFLDIMPRSPGHTLVIPKAPARNILDIKEEDYVHVARATRGDAGRGLSAGHRPAERQEIGCHRAEDEGGIVVDTAGGGRVAEEVHPPRLA